MRNTKVQLIFFLALISIISFWGGTEPAQAAPGEVLILDTSVTGGMSSAEANAAVAAGKTPVLVDATTWGSMTAADFTSYDAIILGDPTCTTSPDYNIGAAIANATVWGGVVDGNVIIIGSDPVYHYYMQPGAQKLINQGIAFAVDEAGKTGAYIDLSCYYHFSGSGTPVPVLDGISGGGFTVIGANYLPGLNDVHIVASHPALAGLTDADLSNWSNSVHEGFITWPIQFEVLAIARDPLGSYTATDGTVGYPYILARGESVVVISDIKLSPESAINEVGTSHTVTAAVTSNGAPVAGTDVTFAIIDGPHKGLTSVAVTDDNGVATFTYVGTSAGIDTIEATFVDALGKTQRSNRVTKEWIITQTNRPPDCSAAAPSVSNMKPRVDHAMVPITIDGVTDADNDPISVVVDAITQDEPVYMKGSDTTYPDGAGIGTDTAMVRAERNTKINPNGRVYNISFTASDGNGGTCSGTVAVCVHISQKKQTCIDDGQNYDSTVK